MVLATFGVITTVWTAAITLGGSLLVGSALAGYGALTISEIRVLAIPFLAGWLVVLIIALIRLSEAARGIADEQPGKDRGGY